MTTFADLPALCARMSGDEKHDRAADSTLDAQHAVVEDPEHVDPADPDAPDRDRFLLSKGHGPMAYYATLAAKGFFDPSTLDDWRGFGSILGHHPDRTLVPGVEIGSGSLGHGLPIALGQAIGLRGPRVFVLLGDGELDEGSNHEAIAVAGRRGQANLTAVVVDNASATHGWPGGIAARFAVEGWATATVDGRDHDALEHALTAEHPDAPLAVVAEIRES
jgi:transketolase